MIYIYRREASQGARELAETIQMNARRISRLDQPHYGTGLRPGDCVVSWGERLTAPEGVRVLNGGLQGTKFEAAIRLKDAGVPTIEVSREVPIARPTVAPVDPVMAIRTQVLELAGEYVGIDLQNPRNPVHIQAVREMTDAFGRLHQALLQPAPVAPPVPPIGEWVARFNNHVGGNDLLANIRTGDYFAKKEAIVGEVRIHSFRERSIRAGKKVPRTDYAGTPHTWVRSFAGGWKIQYDGFESSRAQRDLAHRAVAALGLDFGAVDLGKKASGEWIVLEVNAAPGLEGGTTEAYANAIEAWVQGREW